MNVLIETQFLPSLEFFCVIANTDEVQVEHFEHFVKQSYRNHTFINTANGIEKLTVPLTSKGNRTLIKDVKIDQTQQWKNNQWRTIESAYRNSPFYEHYAGDLNKVLFQNHLHLVDLNMALLTLCLKWLRWPKKLAATKSYQTSSEQFVDMRNVLLSKKPYNTRNFYNPVAYTQVFGNAFVENLSIADLIFCKGPEAGGILSAASMNHSNYGNVRTA